MIVSCGVEPEDLHTSAVLGWGVPPAGPERLLGFMVETAAKGIELGQGF